MRQKKKVTTGIFILLLLTVIALNVWFAITVHDLAKQRAAIKFEYSRVNAVRYGLLSVNVWRNNIREIISDRIEDFTLTSDQEKVLKSEISNVLNAMIDQADSTVQHPKSFHGKIRRTAVNAFVDWDRLRKKVPTFSQAIFDEINKPQNREKLKDIATQKINEYAYATNDSTLDTSRIVSLLSKYHATDINDYNLRISSFINSLQHQTYEVSFMMLGSLLLFLLAWLLVWKQPALRKPLFALSIVLALIVLAVSLSSPMLEIDARIKKIDFLLLGRHIVFNDQILFYRSKSIMDLVKILFSTGKIDSVFVAVLILCFSILFPVTKLISTELYLLGNEKMKKNKVINFFAFRSGKWSMADVMAVAIFMSYVGFKGVITNQLKFLDYDTETLSSITTNLTSLQPAFILFLAFVIFGLVLSEILKRIQPVSHAS
ncbi:MAG TPA: paraquat-inducible protein A [Chitinophagales bacterium]|nr:paraquat-inducible protein A [Chitinophagales bacterium]